MGKQHEEKPDLVVKGRDGSVYIIQACVKPGAAQNEMEFAELLRNAIVHSGLSQYQLAKAANVPQGAISVFLAGGDLRLNTFNRLAHVMGLELRQNRAKAPRKIKPKAAAAKKKA